MAALNETLLRDVLALPLELRTELVNKLLESLNVPVEPDIEHAWAEEAEKRLEEINSGKVRTIPGEDVFKKIHDRYQK
jgi:putative addiction module component (TIGR02574 family)